MKYLLPLFCLLFVLSACKTDSGSANPETHDVEPGITKVSAVCISNGVPLRAEPTRDGKWISSLTMGEITTYLGETAVDTSDRVREYYKVELSDGSVVWARSYGLLLEARPAAIMAETPLYKRPDLVNKTDKSFDIAEFVAIIGEKDDWIEVVGAEKKKSGWISKDAISTEPEEVAVATLAHKEVRNKSGEIQTEKLSRFLEELPYKNTRLAGYFEDLLNAGVESAIEESIMEYEDETVVTVEVEDETESE